MVWLAIAKTDFEWKKHPVLYFNFGQCANATGYENLVNSFARDARRFVEGTVQQVK